MNTRALKIVATSLGLYAATANLFAQVTLTNLYSFTGGDGSTPKAGLVQGCDGYFYGTTYIGGTKSAGTVFRIGPSGSLTTLWTFGFSSQRDYHGSHPEDGLVQDSNGYFYGTTYDGGTNNGAGTVFQISTNSSLKILHTFHEATDAGDGSNPVAGLVQGCDGYFYGTTYNGGSSGVGTIYRINSSGNSYTILHSFTNNPDGAHPVAGLVQGRDGYFYGTTQYAGTNGYGTVFQLNTNGSLTILHSFGNGSDGANPMARLAEGIDGNFYGTASTGGTNSDYTVNYGTVFQISPSGNFTSLYSFTNLSDGSSPLGLVQGSDSNFYGTTLYGGVGDYGTVFRISPSGSYSNLFSFTGGTGTINGVFPFGLVQSSDGNFYGTTSQGGTGVDGTVFKLIVPLNPPANQISTIQVEGTDVLVTIPSVATEFYQLQYRTSLTTSGWSNVLNASVTSIGGSLTATNFGGFSPSQQFYRFVITP